MPHGGDIELELINDDLNTHCALLPSNGDRKFIWLVNHSRGRATLNLDGPGYYWFSSPTGNDEGRGLTGAIVVLGDVPPEARLDRPAPATAVEKEEDMMTADYVDAGEAIDQGKLSGKIAGGDVAPPVVADVNYERILNARVGAAELAHLLRRLQRAAVQPAGPDQHGERQAPPARLGLPGRHDAA